MKHQKFKKRKRLARPRTLVFFGVLFLLMPFLNYLTFAYFRLSPYSIPLYKAHLVIPAMKPMAVLLLLMAFAVGVGLLMVKKWGWYLLWIYALALILYDAYVLLRFPLWDNYVSRLNTIPGFAAVFYFIQRDVSTPYMKMYPRGWRFHKRKPMELEVIVDGRKFLTRDFSIGGFYVDWADCPHDPNDSVTISFEINGEPFEAAGGVVRVEYNGCGIALRGMDASTSKRLKVSIARAERENNVDMEER